MTSRRPTMQYAIDSGTLTIDWKRVTLPLPVGQVIDLGTILVVRLEVPSGQRFNRNVYLLDSRGRALWQIEESPHSTQEDKPYMNVWRVGETLVAGNWNGVDYQVNLDNGKVTALQISR